MTISIVIPAYRRPAGLAEILRVLAPQVAAHIGTEVMVVDNDPAASARDVAFAAGVRYVHETRRGVVNARNRGVAEATGRHIIFLDDDEVPGPDWLAAHVRQAGAGVAASFGRIVPRFDSTPSEGVRALLESLFSRKFDAPTGTDVSKSWAALGTGNSMFDAAVCFPDGAPFDARFNARGGEDSWMINGLLARGIALTWNAEALVEEVVPAERMTLASIKRRKFNHGQLRVICTYGAGGAGAALKAAAWMGAGAMQTALHGARYAAHRLTGSARRHDAAARLHGGLGKLLWWRAPGNFYAN